MDVRLRRVGALVADDRHHLRDAGGRAGRGARRATADRHGTGPATSCRPATTAAFPPPTQSLDQLPLYDGLTPLRGNVTDADIDSHYLPEDFKPVGATHEEPTGHPGTTIVYDSYGVPHVTGKTRADLAFGAGWVTARDRGLLLQLGRGPARAAVADVPGINAFGLVTSGQSFVPSADDRAAPDRPGRTSSSRPTATRAGRSSPTSMAEADGINAYFAGARHRPAAGDGQRRHRGDRVHRFDLRRRRRRRSVERRVPLEAAEPPRRGHGPQGVGRRDAVRRPRGADHDQAAVRLRHLHRRTGHRLGRRSTKARSSRSTRAETRGPGCPAARASAAAARRRAAAARPRPATTPTYPAAGPVPSKQASNFLIVDPTRSATGNDAWR